jgi:hypothetical protein
MKKHLALLNIALLAAILSSIVFQSVHSFEHIVASYAEQHCHHPNDSGKAQITHQHKSFDHCFACEFSFSNFVAPPLFNFQFFASYKAIPYFFYASETPYSFDGSIYRLRGPPDFIV